jgi:hypothetical protein
VDDLVAVAQGVGDQGGWQFLDEAAEGGVPGAAEFDAQRAELAITPPMRLQILLSECIKCEPRSRKPRKTAELSACAAP